MENDLISRSMAKDDIQSWAVSIQNPHLLSKDDTLFVLDKLPAVDAVEVVRCDKCVYFDIIDGTPYCHYWSRNTEKNGFCHNGL